MTDTTTLATKYVTRDGMELYAPFAMWFPQAPIVVDVYGVKVGDFETRALAMLMVHTLNDSAKQDAGLSIDYHFGGNCDHYDYETQEALYVNPQGQCVLCSTGCKKCGSELIGGYCKDQTCPHSDYLQNETYTEE